MTKRKSSYMPLLMSVFIYYITAQCEKKFNSPKKTTSISTKKQNCLKKTTDYLFLNKLYK